MKNITVILVVAIFILLGIQFAFRAAQTTTYTKGEGAIAPVSASEYSPEKLYGNRSAIPSTEPAAAQQTGSDTTAATQQQAKPAAHK